MDTHPTVERARAMGEALAELGIGASLVDRKLRLVWCNRVLKEMVPDQCLSNEHCFEVYWDRHERCSDCLPVLVFQRGEPREGYRERQRPGMPRKLFRVRAIPLGERAGEPTHVLETFFDVSDLRPPFRESPLSFGLATAGHGVYIVDPRRRIVSWSPAMEAIVGYTVDAVLGHDVHMILPPGSRFDPAVDSRGRVETEHVAKDGRIVAVAASTTAILDERGDVCGHQTIIEDRSELHRLRRDLLRGERVLGEIVRASADAIFSTDAEGRITSWNRGAGTILGYEPKEALSLSLADILGDTAIAEELFARVCGGAVVRGLRRPLRHRAGHRVVLEMTVAPIEDAEGQPGAGLSFIARDMTEQERLEQQMIQSEKLAAVGSLAAGLAHEIGTPLNVISATAEYVLLDLANDHPSRGEISTILGETERIRRLVSDLLGFARERAPADGICDPAAAVSRVLRLLRAQVMKRGIEVHVEADVVVPAVRAAEDEVHQVLLNVLLNAVCAVRDKGRIDISVRRDHVPDGERRAAVCFAIGDDGPGIPPDLRRRVFDPFFTTRPDGTGLGLTVCNRIVTDQGGGMQIGESRLGGALVEILLPAVAEGESP